MAYAPAPPKSEPKVPRIGHGEYEFDRNYDGRHPVFCLAVGWAAGVLTMSILVALAQHFNWGVFVQ
ncbi:hypothetical protein [Roseomonas chloroacetimidivorans]|uniref:hypothetical protein n=1 Tax=Roseomonas chloroacetimidivorans TaxID=1766656 RepID=UPI003C73FB4F